MKKDEGHQIIENGIKIRLDDPIIIKRPWFKSAKRLLNTIFPGDKSSISLLDLGCLDGGYTVEFAKLGFKSVGIEVRKTNYDNCLINKEKSKLSNLDFHLDDAWNASKYGNFDVILCFGLLYHLDDPRKFIHMLSSITNKICIINTQFSTNSSLTQEYQEGVQWKLQEMTKENGLDGRWYLEYYEDEPLESKESYNYAAWENKNKKDGWVRSFWITREWILHLLKESGFGIVFEQFDNIGDDVNDSMTKGYYHKSNKGTFVGIKTEKDEEPIFRIKGPTMPI